MTNEARTYAIRTRTRLTGITKTTGRATGTRHSEAFQWLRQQARQLELTGRYDKIEIVDFETKQTVLTIH